MGAARGRRSRGRSGGRRGAGAGPVRRVHGGRRVVPDRRRRPAPAIEDAAPRRARGELQALPAQEARARLVGRGAARSASRWSPGTTRVRSRRSARSRRGCRATEPPRAPRRAARRGRGGAGRPAGGGARPVRRPARPDRGRDRRAEGRGGRDPANRDHRRGAAGRGSPAPCRRDAADLPTTLGRAVMRDEGGGGSTSSQRRCGTPCDRSRNATSTVHWRRAGRRSRPMAATSSTLAPRPSGRDEPLPARHRERALGGGEPARSRVRGRRVDPSRRSPAAVPALSGGAGSGGPCGPRRASALDGAIFLDPGGRGHGSHAGAVRSMLPRSRPPDHGRDRNPGEAT